MNSIEVMREFFGWCSVINIGLLIFTGLMIMAVRKPVARIHAKMFGLDEQFLYKSYFKFIAYYKIVVLTFSIVPYLALVIMS